ncbi:CHASE3 domain-containing protein [Mucilaginibacter sp. SG564]|uniref:CHASE3 domain-containing protein n=1 Tax=Mucilaginibacter sp. SG564 TaxID=2587022 RepID=UPI0015530310|nr:CHASE3 domain-containing protein [Mucilaginibacter sp. SG564]NOW97203.1 PAS domain S-box-containing protein [Mucilaginibacter sp. SG564]
MTSKFNRILQLGYGFSVLMLAIIGLFAYLTVNSLLLSNQDVAHSNLVVQKLEKLLSVMKDAETGQRGYLLTGNQQFLKPYQGSYHQAESLTNELFKLTSDNTQQQRNLANVKGILTHRLNKLQELIDKKQRGSAITPMDLLVGKSAMDDLRGAVDRAEQEEQRLLTTRTQRLRAFAQWTPSLILVAIIFGVLIAAYSYIHVLRDIRQKDRLRADLIVKEQETAAFNEELTAANEEITAANEELTAINEELTKARQELASANEMLELRVEERTTALLDSEQETMALNEELSALNEELTASNEELQATNEELAEHQRRLQELIDELQEADKRSAKLAAIVETSDDAIISKSLEGIITSWNQGAERTFGYAEAEMVGESILKLIPEERHHEEPAIIARIKARERVEHYETRRRTRDGRLIDVSLTISPILDKQGNIIGVSKIARDISEQKLNEQRKNDFIGMASHELKTPLTSLSVMIQVLQQKLRESEDPFLPSVLDRAVRQTQRMTSLINGFLNVSRLESGKLVIDKEDFDLAVLISEQVEEIRPAASSYNFIVQSCVPLTVHADREKIGSVISNLLSNAAKYSLRASEIVIGCEVKDSEVIVSVRDKGMGIQSQDLPKLFERYYRVNSEYTRHISGFGVGLYLSAEIIKHHNGRIWVESEINLGSTFYFSLPLV